MHRGGELSLDISTDLIELSRTPVVVISAGVKSILDVKRTLEYLETFGVPVGTWKSDNFPAFFSPISFDSARDVASTYFAGKHLGMSNEILLVSYFPCSFCSAHGSCEGVTTCFVLAHLILLGRSKGRSGWSKRRDCHSRGNCRSRSCWNSRERHHAFHPACIC